MHQTGQLPLQWRNWAGNQECRPTRIVTPTSLEELREAVGDAAAEGLGVRVMGSGHSFTPVVCTAGVLLDVGQINGDIGVDTTRAVAKIPAGTVVRDLARVLWKHGFSLRRRNPRELRGAVTAATASAHVAAAQNPRLRGSSRR